MSMVIFVFLGLLVLKTSFELWLALLNRRSILAAAGAVPEPFKEVMDADTYDRAVSYSLAKNRLGLYETSFDAVLLGLLLLPLWGGNSIVSLLWGGFEGMLGLGLWSQAMVLFLIAIVLSIPGIPWEWYARFRLEERFGFNKSTIRLWITDKVKGLVIGFILGFPLIALILWLVGLTTWWWLWAFITFFLFQIVMIVVYPMFIMPLFNKFEELPEGELRDRLFALSDRTGFQAKTILVMDGSRRSAHSNAFFTGFGRFRRIVLFDTLIEQLGKRELEAVLAHEIGHYKLGHIPKMVALSAASLFVSFALLGWLAASPWFASAFGFTPVAGQLGPTLLLFTMLGGLVSFWLTPLTNQLSRKHEYEADAFARQAQQADPEPLIGALRTLSEKNLTNLTPHPKFSAFYYSHPTLLERERALRKPS